MRVVVDTNVIISALLSGAGPPAEVLHLVLQGSLTLLVDHRILAEYDEVMARPRFAFDRVERFALLDAIDRIAVHVSPAQLPAKIPDPDDVMFLEVAAAGDADFLITGNTRHFPVSNLRLGVRVIGPRRLMELIRSGAP